MSLASYSEFSGGALAIPGPARAAALLLAMGPNGAARLLKHFSPDDLRAMRDGANAHRRVSAGDLEQLVDDFQDAFKTGSGLTEIDDAFGRLLRETLTGDELSSVFEAGAVDSGDAAATVWDEIGRLGAPALQPMLEAEHPQVAAVIVSRLDPELAAILVSGLDDDFRVDVMRRMLDAKPLDAAAEGMVEERLRESFVAASGAGERQERRAALAEIVNRLEKTKTDALLASIEEEEPEEASAIRSLLFAFEDLPNVPKKARLVLFDSVPTETVTTALRGAPPELAEAVTSALAARARRMVEAELAQAAEVPAKDVAAARRTIASLALRLASEGRIALSAPKEG